MNVELLRLCEVPIDRLAAEWTALEERCDGSFFQSWTWIGSLLATTADLSTLYLIRVTDGDDLVALGILGRGQARRCVGLSTRVVKLNETGRPSEDRVTIEHNGLLVSENRQGSVWRAVLGYMSRNPRLWDELRISGVSDPNQISAIDQSAAYCGLIQTVFTQKPYYWVDLSEARQAEGGYLSLLSSNTRYQIRRAFKLYSKSGDLEVRQADSLDEAMASFSSLVQLHNSYWEGKGQPGAFSNDFTRNFHRRLIATGLDSQQIQFLTVSAGDEPIGYLYNFVYRLRVMSYQSGFRYSDDAKRKPGLICHSLAAQYNAQRGKVAYDFLMGESQYKSSLATREGQMQWLDVQRPLWRFRAEIHLRLIKWAVVNRTERQAIARRPYPL